MSISYEEFNEKLNSVNYEDDMFKLWVEDGRRVMVMTPKGSDSPAGKATAFRAIYETVLDLNWKISVSLRIAAEYVLKQKQEFNPFSPMDDIQKGAVYYIENALFRTTSLWDMLAQGYRELYGITKNFKNNKIDIDHVNYKKFFDPKKTPHPGFEEKAQEIYKYVTDENRHGIVNELRNNMTHKFSPNISVMSDYVVNLAYPLDVQVEAILEDYIAVSTYLKELFDTSNTQILTGFNI